MSQHVSELVVNEARQWIGTPYRHQCTAKGSGTDCLGLIRGIWRVLYGCEPLETPSYSMDWSEPNNEEVLMTAAEKFLKRKPILELSNGDVLLFRMKSDSVAKHLGILSSDAAHQRFIHAYSGHGVVESSLSTPWLRRIAAVFRYPEREV